MSEIPGLSIGGPPEIRTSRGLSLEWLVLWLASDGGLLKTDNNDPRIEVTLAPGDVLTIRNGDTLTLDQGLALWAYFWARVRSQ